MARGKTRRTGQGSITKRADGRWEGAVTTGQFTPAGNPKRVRVYGRTRQEVEQKLQELLTKKHLGKPLTTSRQRLDAYLSEWLETTIKPKRAPSTYRYYEQMVRLYINPVIGHLPLGNLNAQHVDRLLVHWSQPRVEGTATVPALKSNSVNGIRTTLRSALATAWKYKLIDENPVARVDRIKSDQKEVEYLTGDEVGRLIEVSQDHYLGSMIAFALFTGVRIGEALGLSWDDVDFLDGIIRIRQQLQRHDGQFMLLPPKSSSGRRTLSMSAESRELLQSQRANQALWASATSEPFNPMGLVFTGTDGRPIYAKTVDKVLKQLADKAEIKKSISFHKLRHTLATHMAASGKVSLSTLKDQLGHSQISLTVNTYGHAVPSALKDLADLVGEVYKPKPKPEEQ